MRAVAAAWPEASGANTRAAFRPVPRTSDRALLSIGALSLLAFLAAQFLSLTRLFWSTRLGEGATTIASLAGLLSLALLAPAALAYGLRTHSLFGTLRPAAQVWLTLVLLVSGMAFLHGALVKGYVLSAVLHDTAPYLVILACVVLGSLTRVWQDLDGPLLALFAAALAVNAMGMTEMTRVVSEATADDRAGISIVAYRTQGALAFWPLLFLTARGRRPRTAFLIFAGVAFVMAQQILFQKRAPTARILLFILVFLVVLPRLLPRGARPELSEGRVRAWFFGTAAIAAVAALTLAPWLFHGQFAGLAERMSGERYSGGAAGMLTFQNERFFEAGMFLNTIEPQEWVLGRGFGGYFVPEAPGWGVWLDDVNEFGRRQLHVGLLMPFFKGGLALALVYYSGLVFALGRGVRSLADPFAAAAFFVLALHALFLLQEGFFIMSVSYDLVMVGLCMGYLLSRERDARPAPLRVLAGGRR